MGDAEEERHTQGVPNAFLPLTIQLPRQMGGSPTALSRTQSATAGGWPSRFPSGMPAATLATRPCEGSATVCRPRGPVTPTSFAPGCMSPRIFPPSGAPPDSLCIGQFGLGGPKGVGHSRGRYSWAWVLMTGRAAPNSASIQERALATLKKQPAFALVAPITLGLGNGRRLPPGDLARRAWQRHTIDASLKSDAYTLPRHPSRTWSSSPADTGQAKRMRFRREIIFR